MKIIVVKSAYSGMRQVMKFVSSSLFTVFYVRNLKFWQLSKHWSYMQAADVQPEMQDCAQKKIKMQ